MAEWIEYNLGMQNGDLEMLYYIAKYFGATFLIPLIIVFLGMAWDVYKAKQDRKKIEQKERKII